MTWRVLDRLLNRMERYADRYMGEQGQEPSRVRSAALVMLSVGIVLLVLLLLGAGVHLVLTLIP